MGGAKVGQASAVASSRAGADGFGASVGWAFGWGAGGVVGGVLWMAGGGGASGAGWGALMGAGTFLVCVSSRKKNTSTKRKPMRAKTQSTACPWLLNSPSRRRRAVIKIMDCPPWVKISVE